MRCARSARLSRIEGYGSIASAVLRQMRGLYNECNGSGNS
jgi:hypothetical protein